MNYEDDSGNPIIDDDLPPLNNNELPAEVNYKPICPSFHTFLFIILGSFLIILAIIDMIVFYVVPNKENKDNKKKYSDYYLKKQYILELLLAIFYYILY